MLRASLTAAERAVCAALATAAPLPARVGIDLERVGAVRRGQGRYFVSRAERPLARRLGLTALWALKEAAWKALAPGDATPFTALELHASDRGRVTGVSLFGGRRRAGAVLARPWPRFVLAVVWIEEGT